MMMMLVILVVFTACCHGDSSKIVVNGVADGRKDGSAVVINIYNNRNERLLESIKALTDALRKRGCIEKPDSSKKDCSGSDHNSKINEILKPISENDVPITTIQKLGLATFSYFLSLFSIVQKNGKQPLTFFAPTDIAFRRLTADQRQRFLDKKYSADILRYHISRGRTYYKAIKSQSLSTLHGQGIQIRSTMGMTSIQSASVVIGDIISNTSLVHVIDKVLFPPQVTLLDILNKDPRFKIFSLILKQTKMHALLTTSYVYTVFVPNDEVMLSHNVTYNTPNMLEPEKFIRSYLHGSGALYTNNFQENVIYRLSMFNGRIIPVRRLSQEKLRLNNRVYIVEGDLIAKNGVIHVIDGLL